MLERRKLRPIEEFDLARHQDMANVRLDAVVDGRTYLNNFAFVCDPVITDRLSSLAAPAPRHCEQRAPDLEHFLQPPGR